MESIGSGAELTASEAAAQLEAVSDVRERMQADPSRRALAVYGAWSAVAFAAYLLVFLLSWPAQGGTFSPGLLLLPLLLFSTLARGALAARGARLRVGGSGWVIAAVCVIVAAAIVAGFVIDLPLSARIGIPLLLLLVQGVPALALLRRTAPVVVDGAGRPLSTGARVTTIGIGLLSASTVVTAPWSVASGVAALIALMLLFVGSLADGLPWGLSPIGAQWGPWQWGGFAAVAALQGAAVLLASRATWFGAEQSVPMGVAAAVVMTVAAWRPGAAGQSGR